MKEIQSTKRNSWYPITFGSDLVNNESNTLEFFYLYNPFFQINLKEMFLVAMATMALRITYTWGLIFIADRKFWGKYNKNYCWFQFYVIGRETFSKNIGGSFYFEGTFNFCLQFIVVKFCFLVWNMHLITKYYTSI